MADKIIKTRLKNAYKLESEWNNSNPVLKLGEVGYVSDASGRFKIGDGITAWKSLPYAEPIDANKYLKLSGGTMTGTIVGNIQGNASTATALTSSAGSTTKPIYFKDGKPVAISYTVESNVPTNAKFTDTWNKNTVSVDGYVTAPTATNKNKVWKTDADGNPGWRDDTDTTYVDATTTAHGLLSVADKKKLDSISEGANKYTLPVASLTILGGVKSGTDITVDEQGNVSVVDNSHNHTIANVTNLQSTLDSKVPNTRTVNGKALSGNITLSAADVSAIPTSAKGANNGVAELDSNGKIPTSRLPSYVDDVLEGYLSGGKFYKESAHTTDLGMETGKIYVDIPTNKTYRYSGTAFVEISASLAIGTTSSTAFRGDYGQIAYTHATKKGIEKTAGIYKFATNSEGHVTSATAITKADITSLGIPETNTTYTAFVGATANAAGKIGLVPAPAANDNTNKYLKADGKWTVPPNTTYSVFKPSGSGAAQGLVPAPSTTAGTAKYLCENGTWSIPPDTKYTLPTATGTVLGGVKTGSHITNTNGLIDITASNITSALGYTPLNSTSAAVSANKLATSRTITLTTDASGSVGFDGSTNVNLPVIVTSLSNIQNRPTNINFNLADTKYKNKVTYTIASSSTTTGKPSADSCLLSLSWDSNGYGAQLALSMTDNHMYIRGASSVNFASSWGAWKTVLDSTNYESIISTATTSKNGLLSKTDKKKIDDLESTYMKFSGGTVTGPVTFSNNVHLGDRLEALGTAEFEDVYIGGWADDSYGTMRPIVGDTSSLNVNGTTNLKGELHTSGAIYTSGNLSCGEISCRNLNGTNAYFSGTLEVTGEVRMHTRLSLYGTLDMGTNSLKAGDGTFQNTLRAKADFITSKGLKPEVDDNSNIGNSSKYYKSAYINTIYSKLNTSTFINGSKGVSVISHLGDGNSYKTLLQAKSTNGSFTLSAYQQALLVGYQTQTSITANTNSLTKSITLLNEAGNSIFPGIVTAPGGFKGNLTGNASTASSAAKLTTARNINGVAFDGSQNITIYDNTKLPLTGGTITGKLTLQKGFYVHSANGTSATAGFVKFASLKITQNYTNAPIEVDILSRGRAMICRLYIQFSNASSADPTLTSFKYEGSVDYECYIVKSTTSTWDLYAKKSESYDTIYVVDFKNTYEDSGITTTWTNALVTSVPTTNATRATLIGKVSSASTADILTTSRNLIIQDSDASHSGTAVSFNGSSNVNLKLPATIKATLVGNADTATKLATKRTIGLSGVTATAQSFDGSGNITIPITAVPASLITGTVANATSANTLNGFTRQATTSATWGNQIGTSIALFATSTGGGIDIRDNNPNNGQTSIKIDGYFYQNEGKNRCLDESDKATLQNYNNLTNKPTTLKNPNALTLKGGSTTVTYDGSSAQSLTITPALIGALATNGNAVSATKATQDSSGNNIINTYAKKSIYGDSKIQWSTCTANNGCIAFGSSNTANLGSVAFGANTTANGNQSFTTGNQTNASGQNSFAEGELTVAEGKGSHAEGYASTSVKDYSHASGYYTTAYNIAMTTCGKYNVDKTQNYTIGQQAGDAFVIGNGWEAGTNDVYSNAFRVEYSGGIYSTKALTTSGADYAEFIKPWYDGNPNKEDRVGYFVTLKNGLLYKANDGDYIAGITSGNPSIVGNGDEDYYWKFERDEFNRIIWEDCPELVEKTDEEGHIIYDENHNPVYVETGNIIKNGRMKLSSDYDPSLQADYIERKYRPEWEYVGMLGVLPVRDDGTCVAGSFCKCGEDGIATYTPYQGFNTYYVIERINDNIVSVIFK